MFRHPLFNKYLIWFLYGLALAIAFKNIELTAIGFAGKPDPTSWDWVLASAIFAFELALSGSIGSPSFWPILLEMSGDAIEKISDIEDSKYRILAIIITAAFVVALITGVALCYRWDFTTTHWAIVGAATNAREIDSFKVWGYVTAPELLVLAAGLLQLAGGIAELEYTKITHRTKQQKEAI